MKIAIIGASTGQLPLCLKAKELGHSVICFAWEEGAICKDFVDTFYPISILEKDKILEICKSEKIDGTVSNASDVTAEVVSYISTQMKLHGIDYEKFQNLKDKSIVRNLTKNIPLLNQVNNEILTDNTQVIFPCILKPTIGNSKKGVIFAKDPKELEMAKMYANNASDCKIIVEQYISGKEISVETLSYEGCHQIIQITDKESSGAPHFVELGHHQPASLSQTVYNKIHLIIPQLLNVVGIDNGASHIEMKVDKFDRVYLIEINPRGGGDNISNVLVQLSSGVDYIRCMIDVALGVFNEPVRVSTPSYAGVYYLCKQTANRLVTFQATDSPDWLVEKKYDITNGLNVATTNYDRNGYIIYRSDQKIEID